MRRGRLGLVAVFGLIGIGCAAEAPTSELTVTPPPTETATQAPSSTPFPPTEMPVPQPSASATDEPTVVPTITGSVDPRPSQGVAAVGTRPLVVEFTSLHYECQKQCTSNYYGENVWAYRSFQVLMKVRNVSNDLTLAGGMTAREGWVPTRWILTDGDREWTELYSFQWTMGGRNLMRRPDVPPGAEAEWTWLVEPVLYGAWVKAVEYTDQWGNDYRQEFPKPEIGQMNFEDCGEPHDGQC